MRKHDDGREDALASVKVRECDEQPLLLGIRWKPPAPERNAAELDTYDAMDRTKRATATETPVTGSAGLIVLCVLAVASEASAGFQAVHINCHGSAVTAFLPFRYKFIDSCPNARNEKPIYRVQYLYFFVIGIGNCHFSIIVILDYPIFNFTCYVYLRLGH